VQTAEGSSSTYTTPNKLERIWVAKRSLCSSPGESVGLCDPKTGSPAQFLQRAYALDDILRDALRGDALFLGQTGIAARAGRRPMQPPAAAGLSSSASSFSGSLDIAAMSCPANVTARACASGVCLCNRAQCTAHEARRTFFHESALRRRERVQYVFAAPMKVPW